jgi:hypothetical protein
MIAIGDLHSRLDEVASRPGQARAVVTLARVEGRRLIKHPAVVITVALGIVQTVLFLLSSEATSQHDVGWLLQFSALLISFGALLAANLQASKSRRDGSEELFRSAPLSPAARTVALALAAVWLMAVLTLLLLAGDIAIRAMGKGARSDSGAALFPLFDLVQGPLVAGLFVLIGIAVARWLSRALAGPVAIVGLFAVGNVVLKAAKSAAWFRLTPFDPTFLNDGGALAAVHAVYLAGLGAIVLAVALIRHGWARWVRALLAAGLVAATVSGAFQLAS